jgi:hypothetical protein
MRISMYLILSAALFGCQKPNDTATLHDEAVALSTFYRPAIEALNARGENIVGRGGKLGGAMTGGEGASRAISMAGQQLAEIRTLVLPGPNGKSSLETDADNLAKEGKTAELGKLIDESSEKLEVGTRVITTELNTAEAWLLVAEQHKAQMASATPVTPPPVRADTNDAPEPPTAPASGHP